MTEAIYPSLVAVAEKFPGFGSRLQGEDVQLYLKRIVNALGNVAETEWAKLSEEAQQWYDQALDAEGKMKDQLDLPSGFPADAPTITRRRIATSTAPTVYDNLLKTARIVNPAFADKNPRETDNQYLSRLLREQPESIPESIADWVMAADEANSQNKPLPMPPGYMPTTPETPPKQAAVKGNGQDRTEPVVQVPATPAIDQYTMQLESGTAPRLPRKRQTKELPPQEQKTIKFQQPEKRQRTPRDDSVTAKIRDAVTRDLTISIPAIQQVLHEQGMDTSVATITTTRASHLAAIRSLQRAGWSPPA
jgi:hypothetical protein